MDKDGNLIIEGRKKDIIIRGGQNISVKEIEDLLLTHPKIYNVAIAAMPDRKMGEKACAFVIPHFCWKRKSRCLRCLNEWKL